MRKLPKRKEIKAKFVKLPISESEPEIYMFERFCLSGFRPIKQYQIGACFADLAFPYEKIVIEYDGKCHIGREEKDFRRQKFFESEGWKIYRVKNNGKLWIVIDGEKTINAYDNYYSAIDFLVKKITAPMRGEKKNREYCEQISMHNLAKRMAKLI